MNMFGSTSFSNPYKGIVFQADKGVGTGTVLAGEKTGSDGVKHELIGKGGHVYAPAGVGVALCESAVSLVNGEEGILTYRGYPIEQLAKFSNFLDVGFLLQHGELPTKEESAQWKERIESKMIPSAEIQAKIIKSFEAFEPGTTPTDMLQSLMTALPRKLYGDATPSLEEQQADLLALYPSLVALSYRKSVGQDLNATFDISENNGYTETFLRMMLGGDNPSAYEPNPTAAKLLDVLLVVHGDHDQNCSTTALRTIASSHNEKVENFGFFRAVSGALGALHGSRHGKANQDVLAGLREIQAEVAKGRNLKEVIQELITEATDESVATEDRLKLPGIGHRVYKGSDPRAEFIAALCAEGALEQLGVTGELFDIARELREAVANTEYFQKRKLGPNVDFFSGIVYSALGIPEDCMVPMFSFGRLIGWIAQYNEQAKDPKIVRPGEVYIGHETRNLPDWYDISA